MTASWVVNGNVHAVLCRDRGPAVVSHDLLERIAGEIVAAQFGDGAEGLARGQGLTWFDEPPPRGLRALRDDGLIAFRSGPSETERATELLRRTANAALRRRGIAHTEADVQALVTLLLGGVDKKNDVPNE